MFYLESRRYSLASFTYNFQVSHHGVLGFIVVDKIVIRKTTSIFLDLRKANQNFFD